MNLIELKQFINNKTVPSNFMIFLNDNADFLVKQYITEICRLVNQWVRVPSIYTAQQSSTTLLTTSDDCLHIIYTDSFDERAENYSQFENTIVVCSKIDKDIKEAVNDFIIEFKALTDWQIFDYVKTLCPSIDDADISWLIKISGNNVDRVVSEVDKLKLLSADDQKLLLSQLHFELKEPITDTKMYTIIDALVTGNCLALRDMLLHTNYTDLDAVMLSNRVLSKLKVILLVTQNPTLTASSIGISDKYLNRIAKEYRFGLNIEAIKEKIKFLTNFDYVLKTSQLDISSCDKLNYLIANLSYKITY